MYPNVGWYFIAFCFIGIVVFAALMWPGGE